MGAIPAANATCASFFGIGSGGQCTSTLSSIAIAIGTNAEAHADGMLGAALTLGNDSSAYTIAGGWLNAAITLGNTNQTNAAGIASLAAALSGINQTVNAGTNVPGTLSIGNIAMSVSSPEASTVVAVGVGNMAGNMFGSGNIISSGTGLRTMNFVGLNNSLTNNGTFNLIANVLANGNAIGTDSSSVGNVAFGFIGQDNVITTAGALAIGGAIGSTGQTVTQTGPGINVSFNRQAAAAALAAKAGKAPAKQARSGRHAG